MWETGPAEDVGRVAGGLRIVGKCEALPGSDEDQTLAVLWNTIVGSVQDLPRPARGVSVQPKGLNEVFEKEPMSADCQPFECSKTK